MQSKKKLTFSLTSIVVLIAFGLVYLAPSAMATGDAKKTHLDVSVTIGAGESMIDVDAMDHADIDDIQITTGRDRASREIDAYGAEQSSLTITLLVEFGEKVELQGPELVESDATDPNVEVRNSGPYFGADDIFVRAFDKEGRALGQLPLSKVVTTEESIIGFRDAQKPGQQYLVRIDESQLTAAYRTALRTSSHSGLEIASLFFFIPRGVSGVTDKNLALEGVDDVIDAAVKSGIRRADFAHATAHLGPGAHQHMNKASNVFRVDLVDDDQGDPEYAVITGPSTAMDVALNGLPPNDDLTVNRGSGTPGVVSIMRIVDRSGFVERGDFDVRIILTEEPMGGLTTDKIAVENGSVKSLVKGLTYKGGHYEIDVAENEIVAAADTDDNEAVVIPEHTIEKRQSELGPTMVDYYHAGGDAAAEDGAEPVTGVDDAETTDNAVTDGNGTVDNFPEATGRDNTYHSYVATITPNPGLTNDPVTVSITAFDDSVLPISNRYVPLTREQRLATTLTDRAEAVRDARAKNESLTVTANTGADTISVKALATAAYTARQVILDALPNEITLGNKLVIPAGGYAVIVVDRAAALIEDPLGTLKAKVTDAQNSTMFLIPVTTFCRSRQTIWITSSVTAGRSP